MIVVAEVGGKCDYLIGDDDDDDDDDEIEISRVTLAMTQSAAHPSERTNEIKQASVAFGVAGKFPTDQSFSSLVRK